MSSIRSTPTPTTAKPAQSAQTAQPAKTVQQASMAHTASTTKPAGERVAQRAYEKWLKRGCVHGYDVQDWVEAEREVMAEQARSTTASASATATRR